MLNYENHLARLRLSILMKQNAREPLEQVSPVEGTENEITCKEIQMAIKQIKSNIT